MSAVLSDLEATVLSRRGGDARASYVARLFAAGRPKIAQKVGEEAVETVIAALSGDAAAVTGEAADLLFHLTVLLADCGVSIEAVLDELRRREGLTGLAEKAARAAD